jgi:thiamine biosynthesis lipoprotein
LSDRQTGKTFSWVLAATLLAMLLIAAMLLRGQAPAPETLFSERREMLSTYVTVTVAARGPEEAERYLEAAFKRIAELNGVLNAHDPKSEVSRLNASEGPTKVSNDLARAIEDGLRWHQRTEGAFDVTIAPLLTLWMERGKAGRLPETKELEEARAHMGADRIRFDPGASVVEIPKGVHLDLGGLGKGYCADEVEQTLKALGARSALIAVAGDVRATGLKPPGLPWRVGVQDPREPDDLDAVLTTLELTDQSASTSGNYRRYVEIEGKRYSHIVDPRTGLTAENVPSVTVVGPDTVTTDILGTALSVLGVEEGLRVVEGLPGVEALFILFDENDEPILTRSSGFSRFEAPDARDQRR